MHSFPIREQYNAQKLAVHLCNGCPAANPPVLLDGFLDRMIDYALNPLVADNGAVRSLTSGDEIPSALHFAILYGETLREKHDDRATTRKIAARCLSLLPSFPFVRKPLSFACCLLHCSHFKDKRFLQKAPEKTKVVILIRRTLRCLHFLPLSLPFHFCRSQVYCRKSGGI